MRGRYFGNLLLYLAALAISFMIWLIAKQGDTETRTIPAPIRLTQVPENIETRIVPSNAEATLIFPKTFMKNVMEPGVIRVVVSCEGLEARAGVGDFLPLSYPLVPGLVDTSDLPPSVRVVGVIPEKITVEARLHALEIEVVGRVRGQPQKGYELKSILASPPKLMITGSPRALEDLQATQGRLPRIETRPIDIEGAARVSTAVVGLLLPPGLKPVGGEKAALVEVTADIREEHITRTFTDVPIVYVPLRANLKVTLQPPASNIRVKGPRGTVEKLTRDSFRFVPNAVPAETAGATSILTFAVKTLEEGLAEDLAVESDVRTVTLLFEDKNPPTPTPTPVGTDLLLLPRPEVEPLLGRTELPLRLLPGVTPLPTPTSAAADTVASPALTPALPAPEPSPSPTEKKG